jgi:hypothetical protein
MQHPLAINLFGKEVHDLTVEDLTAFFENEQRESDILEFKSYVDDNREGSTKPQRDKAKLNDIVRTVCAFLNSDGGILIWGAPQGKKMEGNKEDTYLGPLTPVSYQLEPDQVINKVASEISPTPVRVKFKAIDAGNGGFYYVFEVGKSEFAPHQLKGTYYMRMDGSTRPAPHHFVEALMKKISFPRIEAFLTFGEAYEFTNDYASVPILLAIHNLSKYLPEKNVQYRIICDNGDIIPVEYDFVPLLNRGTDIFGKKIDILHNRVAHFDHYALVINRFIGGKKKFTIAVFLNGDLSPVIVSKYTIQLSMEDPASSVEISILEKTENVYLADSDFRGLPENEVIENTNYSYFGKFEKGLFSQPLYKAMERARPSRK